MSTKLNASSGEKIKDLKSSSANQDAVDYIQKLITDGTDFDLYKINAFRVAEVLGIPKTDSLRAFLFAAKIGMFDLNWDVHCPSCTGVPAYHKHLMDLANKAHCAFCAIDWDLDFENQVEVTFTVNPDVRIIEYPDFSERDFGGKMQWFDDVLEREKRMWNVGACIYPGESETYRSTFTADEYFYWVPSHMEQKGTLMVRRFQCL